MFCKVGQTLATRPDIIGLETARNLGRLQDAMAPEPDPATAMATLQASLGVPVEEVILGLNPDMEGDSTSLLVAERLTELGIRVTRLARGLPTGSQIEYANSAVLADAIHDRRAVAEDSGQAGAR